MKGGKKMKKYLIFGIFLLLTVSLVSSLDCIPSGEEIPCNGIDEDCSTGIYDYTLQEEDTLDYYWGNHDDLAYDSSNDVFWSMSDNSYINGRHSDGSYAGFFSTQDSYFTSCSGLDVDTRDGTLWLLCKHVIDLDPTLEGYDLIISQQIVHFDTSGNPLENFRVDDLGITGPNNLVFDSTDYSIWIMNNDPAYGDGLVYHFDSIGNKLSEEFSVSWMAESITFDSRDNSFWTADAFFISFHTSHYDYDGNLLSDIGFDLIDCTNPEGFAFDNNDGSFWCLQENTAGHDFVYHFVNTGDFLGTDNDMDGYKIEGGLCGPIDCDDSNKWIHPDATLYVPLCSTIDWDCDGLINEDYVPTPTTCGIGECSGNVGEIACIDGTEIDTCNPFEGAVPEVCDGIDNDCEGNIDNGLTFLDYFQDFDSDNYGNPFISLFTCSQPISYVLDNTDCNDNNPLTNPGMQEICGNLVDDNCDGNIDEGCAICGDGICEGYLRGEDCHTCPDDCYGDKRKCCGNGICEPSEKVKCPIDCI